MEGLLFFICLKAKTTEHRTLLMFSKIFQTPTKSALEEKKLWFIFLLLLV